LELVEAILVPKVSARFSANRTTEAILKTGIAIFLRANVVFGVSDNNLNTVQKDPKKTHV
jgi:hypothetical protein